MTFNHSLQRRMVATPPNTAALQLDRLLSITPYKEGWLRPPDNCRFVTPKDFQSLLTKKDGCDSIAAPLTSDLSLSITPYKEGWLRRQLKIDVAPKGFEACRSRTWSIILPALV
jgi:hypothetical protein